MLAQQRRTMDGQEVWSHTVAMDLGTRLPSLDLGAPRTALVVDADDLSRRVVHEVLADDGWAVVAARSADEAWRLACGMRVDLVVGELPR